MEIFKYTPNQDRIQYSPKYSGREEQYVWQIPILSYLPTNSFGGHLSIETLTPPLKHTGVVTPESRQCNQMVSLWGPVKNTDLDQNRKRNQKKEAS